MRPFSFCEINGRGDPIRTGDLAVPNRARYQLRHAPTLGVIISLFDHLYDGVSITIVIKLGRRIFFNAPIVARESLF